MTMVSEPLTVMVAARAGTATASAAAATMDCLRSVFIVFEFGSEFLETDFWSFEILCAQNFHIRSTMKWLLALTEFGGLGTISSVR